MRDMLVIVTKNHFPLNLLKLIKPRYVIFSTSKKRFEITQNFGCVEVFFQGQFAYFLSLPLSSLVCMAE